MLKINTLDLFCGGGGSSLGAQLTGATIVAGAEIAPYAAAAFRSNFNDATVFQKDLRFLNISHVAKTVGRINLLLASPECTSHTCAKGSGPRSEESRETALQVIRYAKKLQPRWIVIENVVHIRPWKRYPELKKALEIVGYNLSEQVLDASDFGVPQKRKRLFLIADSEQAPGIVTSNTRSVRCAGTILDKTGKWPRTQLFTSKRARGTLERAERAIKEIGRRTPFLLVYYGTDGGGGWQSLDVPLRTITTLDRFALVEPSPDGHTMRMLQPSELKRAMGFPPSYVFPKGTRREKIRILGNAVCPPVMKCIVDCLRRQ